MWKQNTYSKETEYNVGVLELRPFQTILFSPSVRRKEYELFEWLIMIFTSKTHAHKARSAFGLLYRVYTAT